MTEVRQADGMVEQAYNAMKELHGSENVESRHCQ